MSNESSKKDLNERQAEIVDHIDHPLLVDAGPGTGKTSTVVERYLRIIDSGADPRKVLMVTFTNNAAAEMRERIRAAITLKLKDVKNGPEESKYKDALNEVRASTFDSLCLRIVLDAPEFVSEFFDFRDVTLTRNARLVQNETLNKEYFRKFYASFIAEYGHLYVKKDSDGGIVDDLPSVLSDSVDDIYFVICKLMSTGIIPLKDGDWFADGRDRVFGKESEMRRLIRKANEDESLYSKIHDGLSNNCADIDSTFGAHITGVEAEPKGSRKYDDSLLEVVIDGDRKRLFYFINHIYYEFIRRSVSDNRMTFGLVAMFAFCILYTDQRTRSVYSVDYLIVDEFQDTNAMQMDICLMISNRDNICVVGDWKQGIYGFRFASIDNITEFADRIHITARTLNSDGTKRVNLTRDSDVRVIPLNENYRSHGVILDWAFRALDACVRGEDDGPEVIRLEPKRNEDYGENSGFGLCPADTLEEEYEIIVNKVSEYVGSGKYLVNDNGELRQPRYGDIAILYRNGAPCQAVYDRLREEGIPAFLQADQEVMASLPGKLALAWLRFVNDKDDRRGISTILVHEGYSLSQIRGIYNEVKDGRDILEAIPNYLAQERAFLAAKRKRPNDLLTSIFAFHRIGDDDEHSDAAQAIITAISSSFNTSLMTISDMIRLIEDDIDNKTTYPVDAVLGRDAVTVQTMHKSKGLEYPIVIIGGVGKMPTQNSDRQRIRFDPVLGLRCTERFVNMGDGCMGPIRDWRYDAISSCKETDHSEERRLLFVAMSRAKQYMFMTGKPTYLKSGDPSKFMAYFVDEYRREYGDVDPRPQRYPLPEEVIGAQVIDAPSIPEYRVRRRSLDVHSLITYVPAEPGSFEHDGGKEYGNAVHFIADKLVKKRRDDLGARVLAEAYAGDKGMDPTQLSEDAVRINRLIDGFGDAGIFSEVPCSLPVGDTMIHGIIDLIVDDGETISVYDHKTESDLRNLEEYTVQVSIYAHSVMQARGKENVRAFLHYVTLGKDPIEVEVQSMEVIEQRLERYKKETSEVPDADYR